MFNKAWKKAIRFPLPYSQHKLSKVGLFSTLDWLNALSDEQFKLLTWATVKLLTEIFSETVSSARNKIY